MDLVDVTVTSVIKPTRLLDNGKGEKTVYIVCYGAKGIRTIVCDTLKETKKYKKGFTWKE